MEANESDGIGSKDYEDYFEHYRISQTKREAYDMKNLNLPALINQVEKEEQLKKDFLVDTRSMLVGTENTESYINTDRPQSSGSSSQRNPERQQGFAP